MPKYKEKVRDSRKGVQIHALEINDADVSELALESCDITMPELAGMSGGGKMTACRIIGGATRQCDLAGWDLSGGIVIGHEFDAVDFSGADLSGRTFRGCSFTNCAFGTANLTGTRFEWCLFTDCSFVDSDLTKIEMDACTFRGTTDLRPARMSWFIREFVGLVLMRSTDPIARRWGRIIAYSEECDAWGSDDLTVNPIPDEDLRVVVPVLQAAIGPDDVIQSWLVKFLNESKYARRS